MAQAPDSRGGTPSDGQRVEQALRQLRDAVGNEQGPELSKKRIAEVDEKYDSPHERAEEIFSIFQLAADELDYDWSRYDILCFCVQFIGMLSIGELQPDEDLRLLAKNLNRWLHERHYFHAEKIFGEE